MSKTVKLKNDYIEATIRLPEGAPLSQRFDSAGVVEQVVLMGKHRFCQPEQVLPERVTCHGMGLCSEFMWKELAKEVPGGQGFPKQGVGILTQRPEGGIYDKWKSYSIDPFEKKYEIEADRVTFLEEPKICMGIAARIQKSVSICSNTLTVSTTIQNLGEKTLDLSEYQHNFVAIDDLPIGPGYRLELPYDGNLEAIRDSFCALDDSGVPQESIPAPVVVEGKSIVWNENMEKKTYHKITYAKDIIPMPEFTWRLSHATSPASVSETCHFMPQQFSLWGVEHCVCTEVFVKIHVEPGEVQSFARTWRFEAS